MTLSRDVFVSIFLLAVCGVLWYASFDIRVPDYGQLSPATWPRIIIGVLSVLCLIYLIQSARQSIRQSADQSARTVASAAAATDNFETPSGSDSNANSPSGADAFASTSDQSPKISNPAEFYGYWKNVIWCFVLFGLYLYSLPWLGMLLGALAFVFLLLCALGGWQPRKLILHAVIAVATVGGMWVLFTQGLGVLLPTGTLFEFI